MNIKKLLKSRVEMVLAELGVDSEIDSHIRVSNPQFGDYQENVAMVAAKKMGISPKLFAAKLLSNIKLNDIAEHYGITGPGFISIKLKSAWMENKLNQALKSERLSVDLHVNPETIVVDYSSPNVAKEMHVGHLRSTIIGDSVARILEFVGHNVIRQNHIGDWGTQFGMLITYIQDEKLDFKLMDLAELESMYRKSKLKFDQSESFANRSRENVVKLQSHDSEIYADWKALVEVSIEHCHALYKELGVLLDESHVRGESTYNDLLASTVKFIDDAGFIVESDGAKCIYLAGIDSPLIVQKSDGGYLYATTDLAALKYRIKNLDAQRILYFVDVRQSLHFDMVFRVAKETGLIGSKINLEHCAFGTMLGKDGKPFKTRSGGVFKLKDLIIEAKRRAYQLVDEKNPSMKIEEKKLVAHEIGIGAIKYADLSKNRTTDYVFDFDNMLSMKGNTGPYIQYAYARACSIFRHTHIRVSEYQDVKFKLTNGVERALGLKLLQFSETIHDASNAAEPHILCNYLNEVASAFTNFYTTCPILNSGSLISSRLGLVALSARTIKTGLELLGIGVVDRM